MSTARLAAPPGRGRGNEHDDDYVLVGVEGGREGEQSVSSSSDDDDDDDVFDVDDVFDEDLDLDLVVADDARLRALSKLSLPKIRARLEQATGGGGGGGGAIITAQAVPSDALFSSVRRAMEGGALPAAPLIRRFPPLERRAPRVRRAFADAGVVAIGDGHGSSAVMKTLMSPLDLEAVFFDCDDVERLFGEAAVQLVLSAEERGRRRRPDADAVAGLARFVKREPRPSPRRPMECGSVAGGSGVGTASSSRGRHRERVGTIVRARYVRTLRVLVDAPPLLAPRDDDDDDASLPPSNSEFEVELNVLKLSNGTTKTCLAGAALARALRGAGVTPLTVVGARVLFESLGGVGGVGGVGGAVRGDGGLVLSYLGTAPTPTLRQSLRWCVSPSVPPYNDGGFWERRYGGESFFSASAEAGGGAAAATATTTATENKTPRRPSLDPRQILDDDDDDDEEFTPSEDTALVECYRARAASRGGSGGGSGASGGIGGIGGIGAATSARLRAAEVWWLAHPSLRGRSARSIRRRWAEVVDVMMLGGGRTVEGASAGDLSWLRERVERRKKRETKE